MADPNVRSNLGGRRRRPLPKPPGKRGARPKTPIVRPPTSQPPVGGTPFFGRTRPPAGPGAGSTLGGFQRNPPVGGGPRQVPPPYNLPIAPAGTKMGGPAAPPTSFRPGRAGVVPLRKPRPR